MDSRKQESKTESVRDAALGYTTIVLGIICFILSLAVVMATVRFVVSLRPTPATATGAATDTVNVAAPSAAYGPWGTA